eukprot:1135717-Prymnesium_polylepis.1
MSAPCETNAPAVRRALRACAVPGVARLRRGPGARRTILDEKVGDRLALVARELHDLAHVVVLDDGAVTRVRLRRPTGRGTAGG